MKLILEIPRAIRHINAQISIKDIAKKKDDSEIDIISNRVLQEFQSNIFSFRNTETIILNQGNKKRLVKRFTNEFSTENILCQCIKQILDREFKVKYPNRNKISKSLFNAFGSIKHMSDFTIIKFDFKDYFNSVSSTYVYHQIIKPHLSDRFEIDLLKKYAEDTKYAYAGLQTSNAIAEIIAKSFDNEILKVFSTKGILYYERYIDDGIIVLNEYVPEDICNNIITQAVLSVFHINNSSVNEKCKTTINASKFKYISKRKMNNNQIYDVDFLGYNFIFSLNNNKIKIQYGITQAKKTKYMGRIEDIVKLYSEPIINGIANSDYHKLELLRHRILAFTCREVYVTKKFKSNIWKVKGFISNYCELRYLFGSSLLEPDTEDFLRNMVFNAFTNLNQDLPYFLKGDGSNAYSLYYNMEKNRTLLFHPQIGYSEADLIELCRKIHISVIDSTGSKRGYGTLVRDYLIKTKVGY